MPIHTASNAPVNSNPPIDPIREELVPGADLASGHGLRWGEGECPGHGNEERWEQERQREQEMEAELDRLLEKISREGMESLTRRERAFLEKASRRKR